jgi:hypothetical protein
MTRGEQLKCIEENCKAFKRMVLAKVSKIPPNWDGIEIRQLVMDCAKDAWVLKMDKRLMHRYQMATHLYG